MKTRVAVQETKIREHMLRNNVSISSLAKQVGVNQKTLRNFIKGEAAPDIYTAILMADALLVRDVRQLWSVQVVELDLDSE